MTGKTKISLDRKMKVSLDRSHTDFHWSEETKIPIGQKNDAKISIGQIKTKFSIGQEKQRYPLDMRNKDFYWT